ncbi:MAG: transketolase [Candidatus Wildermuthbacteria bacterium]|nr:transketolase [Candidatus Wildermuthbacteria bacterium]
MKKEYTIPELEKKANEIRQDIIKMLVKAGSGHSAGPLGMADVFTALYFSVLKHDPKNPFWEERDRLILSNGHICPVRYAAMAEAGYFPIKELDTLRKFGSRLQGHPERERLPGLETTSGPLGSGLSQASGMAYVGKYIDKTAWRVYCAMSDAEQEAGQTWEAAMFAGKNKLDNLTALIDRNNIQIDGFTEDIMPLEPLKAKYEAFNWHVLEVDGHNIEEIIDACNQAKAIHQKPTVLIMHTIPGKGVSFMENDFKWHGTPPGVSNMPGEPAKEDQVNIALKELRTLGGKIHSEQE